MADNKHQFYLFAGADVTVTDISKKQLEQDEKVAKRDGLTLKTVQGDMSDLSDFEEEYFDIVVNPVSNLFVKDVHLVWNEVSRVLKNKGVLIAGFTNPLLWIFDDNQEQKVFWMLNIQFLHQHWIIYQRMKFKITSIQIKQ